MTFILACTLKVGEGDKQFKHDLHFKKVSLRCTFEV